MISIAVDIDELIARAFFIKLRLLQNFQIRFCQCLGFHCYVLALLGRLTNQICIVNQQLFRVPI